MQPDFAKKSVAILLATYNGERYLRDQLNSIVNQSFEDAKCYIHDDGSTDATISIIKEYQDNFPNRVFIIDGPACGGSKANFMYLLSEIDSDYYFFCDQDDVWNEEKVEKMLAEFMEKEDESIPCVMFSDLIVVDERMNTIANSYFEYTGANPKRLYYKQLLVQNFIAGCSMMFNRKAAMMARNFENIENIYMHDWWVALIASLRGRVFQSRNTLTYYRQHEKNEIGAKKKITLLVVISHIFETLFGKHKNEILERIYRPRKLAKELSRITDIDEDDKQFLTEFGNIGDKGKLSRIKFYIKNKLYRNNHRNWLTMFFV